MGWSPPLGAAARPRLALLGPARGRTLLAARRRPAAARSRALRKPGRRPSPDPSLDPAAQPRGPQPTRARPARAQPTTAWPAAAALTSARRPAPALPAPGSQLPAGSDLAACRSGGGRDAGKVGRAGSKGSVARRGRGERIASAPPRLWRRRVRRGRPGGVHERVGDRASVCEACAPARVRLASRRGPGVSE